MEFYEGDIKGDQTIIESFPTQTCSYTTHILLLLISIISVHYRINDSTMITTLLNIMNILWPQYTVDVVYVLVVNYCD